MTDSVSFLPLTREVWKDLYLAATSTNPTVLDALERLRCTVRLSEADAHADCRVTEVVVRYRRAGKGGTRRIYFEDNPPEP